MEWLNYHHLLYFWTVAREGGISRAPEKLRLSSTRDQRANPATGAIPRAAPVQRQGRTLVMTDVGRVVFRYADEIFGIGGELMDQCAGAPRPLQLTVGVANAVPKFVACRPLHPTARGEDPVYMGCREDNAEQLITLLATHALDVVIRIRRRRRTCASRS